MAGMDWFRWHHGSVTDPKFQLIARRSGASLPDVLAIWAYVLETASQSETRGMFDTIDAEALDCLFNFPEGRTSQVLDAMDERGVIDRQLGLVEAWDKRQPKREREDDGAAERQRNKRARDKALAGVTPPVTPSHATSRQVTPRVEESREEEKNPPTPPEGGSVGGVSASPTKAGEICRAIRAKGVQGVNPSNPELLALVDKGVPLETFEAAAETCVKATPPKGMAYLLGIVKRQLGEAAAIASGVGMPAKPWDESRSSIEAKGVELGLGLWNANDLSATRETFATYTARVRRAVEAMQPA
ncbi:hypothetical protein [Variovorax sp. dw_954]|uniref:hypothetical protein n=1 Tax=Variovorax sp. dw_954 TaxID=2720078 RepID=UPI001BD54732|nr:hypothetical protein [Variovorax sp. dw_954]